MRIDSAKYMEYIAAVTRKIEASKDYVTSLDAVTGDGDHWANMNMGFQMLLEKRAELEALPLGELFKKIGTTIMSGVGGSSGVLYGSAYIAAAKRLGAASSMDLPLLAEVLEAKLEAIMARGNAKRGFKTMIDALGPAVDGLKAAVSSGLDERAALEAMRDGAIAGMESTRAMEAVKGRATYQANKGVGHLDPGAVTMCYQIEALADCLGA